MFVKMSKCDIIYMWRLDIVKNNVFVNERKRLGLTQEQLAKKLNTSRSNVANWENGQNMPSVDLLL